jgi:hypothetical protein
VFSLTFMSTDHIFALLVIERDKLTAAFEALQGPTTKKTPGPGRKALPPSVEQGTKPPASVGPTVPVKRKMTAAAPTAAPITTSVLAKKGGLKARAALGMTPEYLGPDSLLSASEVGRLLRLMLFASLDES